MSSYIVYPLRRRLANKVCFHPSLKITVTSSLSKLLASINQLLQSLATVNQLLQSISCYLQSISLIQSVAAINQWLQSVATSCHFDTISCCRQSVPKINRFNRSVVNISWYNQSAAIIKDFKFLQVKIVVAIGTNN